MEAKEKEWISVKESLPRKSKHLKRCSDNILLYLKDNSSVVGFYETESSNFYDFSLMELTREKVTHWMPLPQPPNS